MVFQQNKNVIDIAIGKVKQLMMTRVIAPIQSV